MNLIFFSRLLWLHRFCIFNMLDYVGWKNGKRSGCTKRLASDYVSRPRNICLSFLCGFACVWECECVCAEYAIRIYNQVSEERVCLRLRHNNDVARCYLAKCRTYFIRHHTLQLVWRIRIYACSSATQPRIRAPFSAQAKIIMYSVRIRFTRSSDISLIPNAVPLH